MQLFKHCNIHEIVLSCLGKSPSDIFSCIYTTLHQSGGGLSFLKAVRAAVLLSKSASLLPVFLTNPEDFCKVSVQCCSFLLTTSQHFSAFSLKKCTYLDAENGKSCFPSASGPVLISVLPVSDAGLKILRWLDTIGLMANYIRWNIQIGQRFPCVVKLSLLCWVAWTRSWANAFPSGNRIASVCSHWKTDPLYAEHLQIYWNTLLGKSPP